MKITKKFLDTLTLDIAKQSAGRSYGHSSDSVYKHETMFKMVKDFLLGKELKKSFGVLKGMKVSNSGCNVWLMFEAPDRSGVAGRQNDVIIHNHCISTTQNDHLKRFGFPQRATDLERFVENIN